MWDTLAPPWQACLEEAWAAYCAGCVPVGAAVTDAGGRILSRGRNRIFQLEEAGGTLYGQPLAHAEVNALIQLPVDGIDRHACALYSTMEPCPLCMGALYMSGVRRLYYASRDPYAGSVDLLGATPYLRRKPVQVCGPDRPDLETILIAMHTEFELRFGISKTTRRLLAVWRESVPDGVAMGDMLFRSGELWRMRAQGLAAAQAFDRLAEMV